MSELDDAILKYRATLDSLVAPENGSGQHPSPVAKVERALLARDDIADILARDLPDDPQTLGIITELDERLKANTATIGKLVSRDAFSKWRGATASPRSGWWWYLDERASEAEAKFDFIFVFIAGAIVTYSLSVITEVGQRFFSVGPDALGTFGLLAQAILTFLVGSTMFKGGINQITKLFSTFGVTKRWFGGLSRIARNIWRVGLAAMLLVIVVSVQLALPLIAHHFNSQGLLQYNQGGLTSSVANFKRAIALDQDSSEAHYNLGYAYEDMLEYGDAMTQYKIALRSNPNFYVAYNNLARLYMLRSNNYSDALTLLEMAPDRKGAGSLTRYALLKNRAWAEYGLKQHDAAESHLQEALQLLEQIPVDSDEKDQGSAAHCLMALVWEAQQTRKIEPQTVQNEWKLCLATSNSDPVRPEQTWIYLAKERLK
jgi:tetratricopeptide (TPR) repeat protein